MSCHLSRKNNCTPPLKHGRAGCWPGQALGAGAGSAAPHWVPWTTQVSAAIRSHGRAVKVSAGCKTSPAHSMVFLDSYTSPLPPLVPALWLLRATSSPLEQRGGVTPRVGVCPSAGMATYIHVRPQGRAKAKPQLCAGGPVQKQTESLAAMASPLCC